jgi:hypothetical protein
MPEMLELNETLDFLKLGKKLLSLSQQNKCSIKALHHPFPNPNRQVSVPKV